MKRTAGLADGVQGFSLLELLVTLFVVVLVSSLVTLNVTSGGSDIRLDAQVRNLADVSSYALDEAQILGVDYGLLLQRVDVDGEVRYAYGWRERQANGWQLPTTGKDLFAEQQFPAEIEMQLELEGIAAGELPSGGGEFEPEPQVVLYASGETTPGAIDVRRRDNSELQWRIEWDLLGRFELLRHGEVQEDL